MTFAAIRGRMADLGENFSELGEDFSEFKGNFSLNTSQKVWGTGEDFSELGKISLSSNPQILSP